MNSNNHHTDEYARRSRGGTRFAVQSSVTALLLLLISIFIVYSNTLDVPWHFDDRRNIVEREELHLSELSWEGVKDTFYYENRLYRPVACLSFALNHYFHQLDLAGYHLVNIAVHVLAAWFLFLFVRVTLAGAAANAFYRNNAFFIAFIASLIWALHPIQTQSVTYIVQRMASMAGMFYIMCMYLYARARIREYGGRKWVFLFLSLIAGILALGSKENAALLPFSIALYEFTVLSDTPVKDLFKAHWKILVVMLLCVAAGFFVYLELVYGGRISGLVGGYRHRIFSLEERLLTQPRIIIFYLSLLLYPHPSRLSILHDIEVSTSLFEPVSTVISTGVILTLVAGAFTMRRRSPFVTFSVLFFFLNHAIESTFIPLELIFEHRNYIPSMLLFVPPAMLLAKGVFHPGKLPVIRGCSAALAVTVPLALGTAAHLRNFDWKSPKTLWINAAQKSPNTWRPFHNAGVQFALEEDHAQALEWFKKALTKKNTTGKAEKHQTFYEIGAAYQAMGMDEAALLAYRQADKMYPGIAKVHVNMGVILMNREERADALAALNEALKIEPSTAEAHSNLGWLQFKSGDPNKGLHHLRKAVQIQPSDLVTLKRLAYVLMRDANYGESERLFKGLRKDKPEDLSPLLFLAEIYQKTGRKTEAKNAIRLMARLVGENGLTRLKRFILKQEDHPATTMPDKDTIISLIEAIKSERASVSPGTSLPDTLPHKNPCN